MRKQYHQTTLSVSTLDNAEFYQLISETKSAIVAFNKGNKQEAMYATNVALLDTLMPKLQATLHNARSSATIQAMESADSDRDDAFKTLSGLIRAFSRVKDTETKAAYMRLSTLFKHYTGITEASYEKESEAINHLLAALKEEANQTAVTRLHLTVHVTALTQAQAAFDKAYKERLAEQKGKTVHYTKKLRQEMSAIYELLVDFTAVYAAAYPDRSAYVNLHQTLNAIRERYKHHQGTKKKTKDTTKQASKDSVEAVTKQLTEQPIEPTTHTSSEKDNVEVTAVAEVVSESTPVTEVSTTSE